MAAFRTFVPYFAATSLIRRSPRRTAAMPAQRSPSRKSGMRELTAMISKTCGIISPREMSFTAGIP